MEKKSHLKILFIGKKNDYFSTIAAEYIKTHIPETDVVYSLREEPIPDLVINWRGDYIISYLSQWIIPNTILANAKIGAINLHPGSPSYPGIGCTNFAIYNNEKEFGITCHFMLPKVDTGGIIKVKRFLIHESETVYTLTQRCYSEINNVFFELVDNLLAGNVPTLSGETWLRKAYTRKELNALCQLDITMSEEEVNRRIKATTFGEQKWAYFYIHEKKYLLQKS